VKRVLVALVLLSLVAGSAWVPLAGAAPKSPVPTPTLSVPPVGLHGHPMWDSWYDLKPFGYTEQELFVSGTATDASGTRAPYTTRFVVFRPSSPRRFNGTVLLDWTNVTAQFENAVDTMEARQQLMREGFAFVHVSAQKAGLCCSPLTPKVWDPVRYAAINHPGDQYADDIFSQIAQAFRKPAKGPDPMGGMRPKAIIAAGQSQSASKLYSYVSSTAAKARVIDGFLIHGGGAKTFPKPLTAKVIHLLSDREAAPAAPSRDPFYRLWEVAGTAHSDYFIGYQSVFGLGPRVLAHRPAANKASYEATMNSAGTYGEKAADPFYATCILAGSTMPMHYATSTAIHQLNRWVRKGVPAISTPRYRFTGGVLAADADGNSLGGMRLPPIEVPVASYKSNVCPLGGSTVPFTNAELVSRYPTFAHYWAKMRAATDRAVRAEWVLAPDAIDMMRRVCGARTRWGFAGSCPSYRAPA